MELKKEARNVLVGVSLEKESIELIAWAIVKVAQPGHHLLALHVHTDSEDASSQKQLLDDYIQILNHLCHLKKVNLTGKILTGKSIRKTLVREAKHSSAVALIVGISKICTIGGWASTGKYCAKHLPSNIKILTLYNGKVFFERNSTDDPLVSGPKQIQGISSRKCQSEFGDSEISRLDSNSPTTVMVHQNSFGTRSSTDSTGEALENRHAIAETTHAIPKESTWGQRSVSSPCTVESRDEAKPGWPLLRRTSLPASQSADKDSPRKMSVVQWVMSLPDRSPPESPQSISTDTCSTKSENGLLTSKQPSLSMLSKLLEAEESGIPLDHVSSSFTWFSYEALRQATLQFSPENVIGKGGNSQVYKGVLEDGKQVAVKVVKSSKQARKDFSAEVNILSSLRHKNITLLLGVCISDDELISVYQFMPNGSLEENLHGQKKQNGSLSWESRYRVIIGIAEALVYLHNECSNTVIHRDIKSSNILLSDDMDPQVSDFGLVIWAPKWESGVEDEGEVVGTFGYMAPEYVMYGKVTDKVDVYSFGVVLLEVICGRKPIIDSCQGQESLMIWAKPMIESGRVVKEVVDPSMEEERWDEAQMQRMVVAASLCLTRDARHRPNMAQILRLLKGEESGDRWLSFHVSEQGDGDNNEDVDEKLNNVISSCLVLNTSNEDDFTSCNRVDVQLHSCIRLCLADFFNM